MRTVVRKWTWRVAVTALVLPLGACASAGPSAFDRGVTSYRDERYADAVAQFDSAIRRAPTAAAYTNRGAARLRLGEVPGAINDYTGALQLSPNDADTWFDRGNAYAAAGNEAAAIADYSRALELRPGYARALFNRGTARERLGDTAGARSDWTQAIQIEPDPWTQAAMRRAAGFETSGTPPIVPSPTATVPPAPPAPPGAPPPAVSQPSALPSATTTLVPEQLDARDLAIRAITRGMQGDWTGALEDLRTAVARDTDPARRTRLQRILNALESAP